MTYEIPAFNFHDFMLGVIKRSISAAPFSQANHTVADTESGGILGAGRGALPMIPMV